MHCARAFIYERRRVSVMPTNGRESPSVTASTVELRPTCWPQVYPNRCNPFSPASPPAAVVVVFHLLLTCFSLSSRRCRFPASLIFLVCSGFHTRGSPRQKNTNDDSFTLFHVNTTLVFHATCVQSSFCGRQWLAYKISIVEEVAVNESLPADSSNMLSCR